MDGAGSPACPGPIGRYLAGLCAAGLGLCAAGWLVLTPFAFGYQGRGWHAAALTDRATGGGLAVVCLITLTSWSIAWRRALRADGVLTSAPRRPARRRLRPVRGEKPAADSEQVLTALRTLLAPLLPPAADEPLAAESAAAIAQPVTAVIPGPRNAQEGIVAIESMLAGAELLMTGCDEEEETW